MRKSWCDKCHARPACKRPCKIVEAELKGKGVYEYERDPDTGQITTELMQKDKEIKLVFMAEPYTDKLTRREDRYDEESRP